MLKRHAVQVLRNAGHSQREVAGTAEVSIDTVRRVEREPTVADVDDVSARQARRIGRPSMAAPYRSFVVETLEKEPGLMSLELLRRDAIGIAGTLFLYRDRVRIVAGRFEASHGRLLEPGATLPEHRAAMVAAVSGKRGQRYLKRLTQF